MVITIKPLGQWFPNQRGWEVNLRGHEMCNGIGNNEKHLLYKIIFIFQTVL